MSYLNDLLARLRCLPYTDKMRVVGDAADPEITEPSRLELVVDVAPLIKQDFIDVPTEHIGSSIEPLIQLLAISWFHPGRFDPMLATKDDALMVQNDSRTSFVPADMAPADVLLLKLSGKPFCEVDADREDVGVLGDGPKGY